jgi:hypothetical protein
MAEFKRIEPTVGSEWICLTKDPYSANINVGQVVRVELVTLDQVAYTSGMPYPWYCPKDEWHDHFTPAPPYTPKAIEDKQNTCSDDSLQPDGSVASYYDFPKGMVTLNDYLEHMGETSWLGDSFHLANIVKAATRWGRKGGTTKSYDARKFIYSGCRLLMKYTSPEEVRSTLLKLLDDPQFQPKKDNP